MKLNAFGVRTLLAAALLLFAMPDADAQFLKKLGKKAQQAAERTVERRVEQETSEKTDQALDSILEPGQGQEPQQNPVPQADPPGEGAPSGSGGTSPSTPAASEGAKTLEIYSKFDYVPGDEILFYDDFADDFIGDFPAKWNTNGSGEVVTTSGSSRKWLKLLPGYRIAYIPATPELPTDYTIEFDMLVSGMDRQTSSTAGLTITLDDNNGFQDGRQWGWVFLPVGQYGAFDIRTRNYKAGEGSVINSSVQADIRQAVLNQAHVSIAVNDQRFRLWVNEQKYVDIPQFVPEAGGFKAIKFNVNNLKDNKEDIFIANVKVAEGGVDLRRKLLSEGRISTNAILFDSGSANLQPESMGVIRQIFQVLQQDPSIRLQIVGHTDSDGETEANQTLSEQRAAAVKDALVSVYGADPGRLTTLGKGESEPVSDNNSPGGKAKNRRVEFIKS